MMSYYLFPKFNFMMNHEINYAYVTYVVAESFYESSVTVGTEEKITVRDYIIEDNKIYIFPLDNNVVLPFGVMVTKVNDESIEVVVENERFKILNLDKIDAKLYQYIPYENAIGKTDSFYVIEGNIGLLVNNLEIYYEQV